MGRSFSSYSNIGEANGTHTHWFAYSIIGDTVWSNSVTNTLCSPIVLESMNRSVTCSFTMV